ncbi:MAG TPA: ABC transporter permease, partial [Pedobacter sp.]
MWLYVLRKSGYGAAVMAGVVIVVFILFNILPGDPARMTLGQRADVQSLEAVRKEFGLDQSKPMQFLLFINDLSPIGYHENDPLTQQKYHYITLIPFSSHV